MLAVKHAPEIEDDLAAAAAWYLMQRTDLAEEFLQDYQVTAGQIAAAGQTYRRVVRDYRRLHFTKFPYSVYFTVHGEIAVVYLVIHASRDPALIEQLLGERHKTP